MIKNSEESPLIQLPDDITDHRGLIRPLLQLRDPAVGGVLYIESTRGAVRANHYHKKDWHYCYFLRGSAEYYSRPAGSSATPDAIVVGEGEMVYTPPLVEHAMVFAEDSSFLAISAGSRLQADYESDLVRVELVSTDL